jgi:hypothetical protein
MRKLVQLLALAATVLVAQALPGSESALAQSEGQLTSDSFRIRMYALNSAGTGYRGMTSYHFQASGCLESFGSVDYLTSTHFQMLYGYCWEEFWYLSTTTAAGIPIPQVVINTALGSPAPNPATGPVRISYAVRAGESASLRVYDVAGRLVRILADAVPGPVGTSVTWDLTDNSGRDVRAGIYFVRLDTPSEQQVRRIVLLGR